MTPGSKQRGCLLGDVLRHLCQHGCMLRSSPVRARPMRVLVVSHHASQPQELGGGPDADELRAEPLGRDARGARYFFLAVGQEDCRLYREDPPPRARKGRKPGGSADAPKWAVACSSIEVRRSPQSFTTSHRGSS